MDMKKVAGLALGLACVAAWPSYTAAQELEKPALKPEVARVEQTETIKPAKKAVPVRLKAEHVEYEPTTGDFSASGNVVITQGPQTMTTTYATGNMKTGDVWLAQGGKMKDTDSLIEGSWAYYNINTKTGELRDFKNHSGKDFIKAPHALLLPDKFVADQGGEVTRCTAILHRPCMSVKAKNIEFYPGEKMIAHDVQIFVKGKHLFTRKVWINEFDGQSKTGIHPKVGYDGGKKGFYIGMEIDHPITKKDMIELDLYRYSRANYRPVYSLKHSERNWEVKYMHGWDEDDDIWYKKENNWTVKYKPHHFIKGIPVKFSAEAEYGFWKMDTRFKKRPPAVPNRWHKDFRVYLTHDPIYLFNSKDTVLNLRIGRRWKEETYGGKTQAKTATNTYNAVLRQQIGNDFNLAVGYFRSSRSDAMFQINEPDMSRELRPMLTWTPTKNDTISCIYRYDLGYKQKYEVDYKWLHKFCCWAIEIGYEREYQTRHNNSDHKLKVMYYFDNW